MKTWDVFISHASEDKLAVAIPLAEALQRAGLRVWLDREELRIGDSLREKINEGLANSRFGVVILSPSFLAKGWPTRELDALFALEDVAGRPIILPVLYRVDTATLPRLSPTLAGRLAADVAQGIPAVASSIIQVVTEPGSGAPVDVAPTPGRLLITLLEREPDRPEVVGFLASHPAILQSALGFRPESERWSTQLGPVEVDFCGSREQHTTREVTWHLVQFQPPAEALFLGGAPCPAQAARASELRNLRRWIGSNLGEAREILPAVTPGFSGIVVAGRRQQLSEADQETLRRYNHEMPGLTVRTYDWLIDAAVARA